MVLTLAAGVSWLWVPPREVTRGVVVRVGSLGRPLPAFGPARLRMSDPTHHSPTSTSSTTSAAPAFGRRLRELGEVLRRLRLVPVLALVLVLAMRRIRPPAVGGRAEVERTPTLFYPAKHGAYPPALTRPLTRRRDARRSWSPGTPRSSRGPGLCCRPARPWRGG